MAETAAHSIRLRVVGYVLDFSQGDASMRDLLGGKGAGLAEMTRLGLRVPPGFTITTDACRYVMEHGKVPDSLWHEVDEAIARLEVKSGRILGEGPTPLLVSVRSGAKFSMPGMMDTVLNLGINDELVGTLAEWSHDRHFAWDAYRRFVQMYGEVVLGLPEHRFQEVLTDLRASRGVADDSALTADDLAHATRRFQQIIDISAAGPVPADPREQLRGAISAVFSSWGNRRAQEYRRLNNIPDDLGTAANVQMMVFGDLGESSGTGVCFTRDPASGEKKPYGDYLAQAQGEDVVAGIRNTSTLDDLAVTHPACHAELLSVMEGLERHYRDMCDIEFTIERGKLWILQTRAGKRTAPAAVRIAVDMTSEGIIDRTEAVRRVDPGSLEQLERPRIDDSARHLAVATGVAASPGAATGRAVFDADRAAEWAKAGEVVILVRPETTPDDIHGMAAARGILTAQGGKTSHAAVVARGMGKAAVTGVSALVVDLRARHAVLAGHEVAEGDTVTIDGTSGAVYVGAVKLVEPRPIPELEALLDWADRIRTLGVRANADMPEDAVTARRAGAEGIGLARTEHMFMGERISVVQRIILTTEEAARRQALADLKALQVADFEGLLAAMDGLPVVVRLLDPPLHEFLPSRLELEQEMVQRVRVGKSIADLEQMSAQVAHWEEDNPMLGLRGVRLGLIVTDLYKMQIEAALEAVIRRLEAGGDPRLEIMIPLVADAEELRRIRSIIEPEILRYSARSGRELEVPIGTMIELPRAALVAGEIASVADFFSFGTNDLTQMTYGLSRDDAEALFLHQYLDQGILKINPFQTLDREGVGRLVQLATTEGRKAKPNLTVGVCGEHGGDPASIHFCREVGLDYVSCSPPRIKVARLAAAQAELAERERDV
ncbi:MAG TPA: pyruvate, phosphate dikinase [Acidimicrobiia bacterium]|nr:pyruvate, phosphate dikinase [Acidimicrobiia bacterium]